MLGSSADNTPSHSSIKLITLFVQKHLPGAVIGLYFVSTQLRQSIDFSFLILLAGSCLLLIMQPNIDYRRLWSGAAGIALLLLVSTMLPSMVMGQDFVSRSMAVAQIPGILVFVIAVLFIREKSQIQIIALSFLLALAISLQQFFNASRNAGFSRGHGLIFDASHTLFLAPNDILMFAIFLPLIVEVAKSFKNIWGWVFGITYLLCLIGLSELLLSRITFLTIALTFLLPVLRNKQRKALYGIVAITVVAVVALTYFDRTLLEKLQASDLSRIKLWIIAWHMFLDAPWLGHGPGSFTVLYTQYLDQFGNAAQFGGDPRHMGWAHNLFLESAAEKGMVGLMAVVGYFGYLFAKTVRYSKQNADSYGRAVGLCTILLLLAACAELSMLRLWAIYELYLLLGLSTVLVKST